MNEDGGSSKGALIIGLSTPVDQVFECCWDNCDWQFEDMTDCIDHCIAEQNGHVQASFLNAAPGTLFIYSFHLRVHALFNVKYKVSA